MKSGKLPDKLEEIKTRAPELWEFMQEVKKVFGGGKIKEIEYYEKTNTT